MPTKKVEPKAEEAKPSNGTAEFFATFGPVLTALAARLDQKFEIELERDKVKLEKDRLDLSQKDKYGVPSREKLEISLELEALNLRRQAAREETNAKVLTAEAEVIENYLAGLKRKKEDANAA